MTDFSPESPTTDDRQQTESEVGNRVAGNFAPSARTRARNAGTVIAHAPEAILAIEQVAEWLQVSVRTVERLDIPCVFLGYRTKRFLGKDVIKYMEQRKAS